MTKECTNALNDEFLINVVLAVTNRHSFVIHASSFDFAF